MHSFLTAVPLAEQPEQPGPYYRVGANATQCLLHAERNAAPIGTVLPGFDGSGPWTWTAFAAAFPAWAAVTVPHEWSGEPTAAGLDPSLFPLSLPPELPE